MIEITRQAGTAEKILEGYSPKTICAWCRRVIKEGALPATHGICGQCAQRVMGNDLQGEVVAGSGMRGKG
jgi:hypothetical protein